MDVTAYMGSTFLKVEDIRNGTRKVRIKDCRVGRFDKLDLYLDDGDRLSLNATNVKTLARKYGKDSQGWIGQTIELYIGPVEFKGQEQDSVLVRPVSPQKPQGNQRTTEPGGNSGGPDDEIPFSVGDKC